MQLARAASLAIVIHVSMLLAPSVLDTHRAAAAATCEGATPVVHATPIDSASPAPVAELRISLGADAGEALVWDGGSADGVVLAHGAIYDAASWKDQATAMADAGISVVAVEQASATAVVAAVGHLRRELGVQTVTLIGASAGGGAVLSAIAGDPELADRLVLLSATGDVSALGDYPKLFIASKDEGIADRAEAMVDTAPGDDNQAVIVPGDAHAQAIFKTDEGDMLLQAMIDFITTGCV